MWACDDGGAPDSGRASQLELILRVKKTSPLTSFRTIFQTFSPVSLYFVSHLVTVTTFSVTMKGLPTSTRSGSPILPSSSHILGLSSTKVDSSPRRTTQVWHGVRLVGVGFVVACLLRAYTPLGAASLGVGGWSWGAHGPASSCSSGVETWGST